MLLYTLDAIPILLCCLLYCACHPGWLLPREGAPAQVAPLAAPPAKGGLRSQWSAAGAGSRPGSSVAGAFMVDVRA